MPHVRSQIKSYDLPLIEEAAAIINKKPTEHLSADQLAVKVGMSSPKLRSGFKIVYKTTIYQYQLNLCLEMAKDLLERTDLTMEAIACRTGFGCRRSFGRCFTQKYGISPKQWRNRPAIEADQEAGESSKSLELVIDYCLN